MAFAAYFDDSGKSGQHQIVAAGGAVSTVDKWDKLSMEWVRVLHGYGLDMFHMKDLYREFRGRRNEADALLQDLSALVKRYTNKTFSMSIFWRDWNKVNVKYQLKEQIGSPFPFAAVSCLSHLEHWAKNQKRGLSMKDIQCWFEHGSEDYGLLIKLCRKEFGIEPFMAGKSLVPLQVADLIAWQGRREMEDRMKLDDYQPTKAQATIKKAAYVSGYMSRPQIEQLAIEGDIPKRC